MDLKITKTLVIPSNEIKWRFSRSSGPGGQNVNKIESRVEIIFNLEDSKVLNDYQKEILKRNLKNKLVNNSLRLAVQEHRNQLLNRQLALIKLSSMIKNALNKTFKLIFEESQSSVTPGQAAVFYKGEILLGGGLIN